MSNTRRHLHAPIKEPEYELELVSRAKKLEEAAQDSVVVRLESAQREAWDMMLGEFVMLCNHAEVEFERRARANREALVHSGKPLSVEYIVDRIDTDEPLNGYVVRSRKEGWMQGFIACTTFTTWQRWFKWDSLAEEAGLLPFEECVSNNSMSKAELAKARAKFRRERKSGSARKKKSLKRLEEEVVVDGDEINTDAEADEDENENENEGSDVEEKHKAASSESASNVSSPISGLQDEATAKSPARSRSSSVAENASLSGRNNEAADASQLWWDSRIIDADGRLARALENQIRDGDANGEGIIWPHIAEVSLLGALGCGSWLLELMIEELERPDSQYDYVVLQAAENSVPFYEKHGFVRVGAIARYAENENDVEQQPPSTPPRNGDSHKKKRKTSTPTSVERSKSKPKKKGESPESKTNNATEKKKTPKKRRTGEASSSMPLETSENEEENETEKEVWMEFLTYKTGRNDTLLSIGKKQGIDPDDILFLNKRHFKSELTKETPLPAGSLIRLPKKNYREIVDPFPLDVKSAKILVTNDSTPGCVSSNGVWYAAQHRESLIKISNKLKVNVRDLIHANNHRYGGELIPTSMLIINTALRVPHADPDVTLLGPGAEPPDPSPHPRPKNPNSMEEGVISRLESWKSREPPEPDLTEVTAYRHWSFADDPIAQSVPSYMMARPLRRRPPPSASQMDEEEILDQLVKSGMLVDEKIFATRKPFTFSECMEKNKDWVTCALDEAEERGEAEEDDEENDELMNHETLVSTTKQSRSWDEAFPSHSNSNEIGGEVIPEGYRAAQLSLKLKGKKDAFYGPLYADFDQDYPIISTAKKPSGKLTDLQGRQNIVVKLHVSSCLTGPIPMMISKRVFPPLALRKPVKPPTAFQIYEKEHEQALLESGVTRKQVKWQLKKAWYALDADEKKEYVDEAASRNLEFVRQMRIYQTETMKERWVGDSSMQSQRERRKILYNKIVKVQPKSESYFDSMRAWASASSFPIEKVKDLTTPKYLYYFVLTYIPDLNWCSLVPLRQNGVFGEDKKSCRAGRPKWVLVPESEDHEIDVSASRCEIVKGAFCARGCDDADEEEWDIVDMESMSEEALLNASAVEAGLNPDMEKRRRRDSGGGGGGSGRAHRKRTR